MQESVFGVSAEDRKTLASAGGIYARPDECEGSDEEDGAEDTWERTTRLHDKKKGDDDKAVDSSTADAEGGGEQRQGAGGWSSLLMDKIDNRCTEYIEKTIQKHLGTNFRYVIPDVSFTCSLSLSLSLFLPSFLSLSLSLSLSFFFLSFFLSLFLSLSFSFSLSLSLLLFCLVAGNKHRVESSTFSTPRLGKQPVCGACRCGCTSSCTRLSQSQRPPSKHTLSTRDCIFQESHSTWPTKEVSL